MLSPDVIRLEGAPNFRDFGAYTTADGRPLRRGLLFRSGTLSALTKADFAQLSAMGLALVCDLRSQTEVNQHPTPWPSGWRPQVMHLDVSADLRSGDPGIRHVLRNDPTARGAEAMMLRTYRQIPRAVQGHLRALLCALASEHALPVILHCTAGKDRTGVLVALIQRALGVAWDDVLADYLLTRHHVTTRLHADVASTLAITLGVPAPHDVVTTVTDVRESYLQAAFAAIDETHGSLDNYWTHVGLDVALLTQLRQRLLVG